MRLVQRSLSFRTRSRLHKVAVPELPLACEEGTWDTEAAVPSSYLPHLIRITYSWSCLGTESEYKALLRLSAPAGLCEKYRALRLSTVGGNKEAPTVTTRLHQQHQLIHNIDATLE